VTARPNASLAPARPRLSIDGRDLPGLAGGLLELAIRETVQGLYRCEALFNNWGNSGSGTGFLYFDRQTLEFGKRFEVSLGDDRLFEGRIMALQGEFPGGGSPRVRILAEDRLQDLRMTRRTRSFADASDSEVIQRIGRDHGLSVTTDLNGPTHKILAQVNQSDLAFLRDRARALGAEVWIDGTTLHAAPRASRSGQPLPLVHGARLREFSVLADLAGQCTKLAVGGWDVAAKSAIKGEAAASILGGELGNDESGAAILGATIGERQQVFAHTTPFAAGEARSEAESRFRATARHFVVGRGVADTDPGLRVGTTVDLDGLGPLFSGKYYISETQVLFDGRQGLRTEFTGERPGLGRP
jgi:phage protein D